MNSFQTLFSITSKLASLTSSVPSKENRDEVIEEINQLLNERDHLIPILPSSRNEEEEELVKKIIVLNEQINQSMSIILGDIKSDITSLKGQKKAHNQYLNPYKSLNNMSAFFDKKE